MVTEKTFTDEVNKRLESDACNLAPLSRKVSCKKEERMIKSILMIIALVCCFSVDAGSANEDKVVLEPTNKKDKKQLIIEVAALMGKEVDPNDPEALQAAEAFLVLDAAKAYALTHVHAVPLEFCPKNFELADALSNYKKSAEVITALGQSYYANGFDLTFGEKRIRKSGQELQDGLNRMLEGIRKDYEGADAQAARAKCNESVEALRVLAQLYGG